MDSAQYQGHSTFRSQPSYTIFNKSFEDPKDMLFLQLNEIDPYFLTEEQLEDKSGFYPNELVDPRTRKEQKRTSYDYTDEGRRIKLFRGGGIKSTLLKRQHEICLRVLLGWQDRKQVDEADLIVWRQLESKIQKEREHMHKFISEYAELHKEDIYTPIKRLNEYYRHWFKQRANKLLKRHTENLAFNTHAGLPHVSVCKNIDEEKPDISSVVLLERRGWIRIHDSEDEQINWKNFNFRLDDYVKNLYDAPDILEESMFENKITVELSEYECDKSCFIPFEAILFLLTAGDYVDLPTECLLEISDGTADNHKTIKFDSPFPARNCGWHTQQQVVEGALTSFHSLTGRSKWLHVKNETVEAENLQTSEIHAVSEGDVLFKPLSFERYLENMKTVEISIENQIKSNTALIKWYLKSSQSVENLKILTTLSLPPTLDEKAEKFLAHETLKLEYKPQFGCESLTKYELLRAWLKMRLMNFNETTNYGFCYRISSTDCDIQLKEHLTLEVIEQYLKYNYHVNPAQLIANLAEFLKLLYNMPTGKYMLRYNSKYKDKLLLCAPSREITQNTVYLHSLLQVEPTDMIFMTQSPHLPIIETLCSRVHLKYKVLPCAFLPKLSHQKNLQTPAAKAKSQQLALMKRQAAEKSALKSQKSKGEMVAIKREKNKRWRQRKKRRAAANKLREEADENKKLFEF